MELKKHVGFGIFRAKYKTASAQVQVTHGTGKFEIQNLCEQNLQNNLLGTTIIVKPLLIAGLIPDIENYKTQNGESFNLTKISLPGYDIKITVVGGGFVGQARAIQRGLAQALAKLDASKQPLLKREGQLSQKVRRKERKKYGLKKARKAPQFSKR